MNEDKFVHISEQAHVLRRNSQWLIAFALLFLIIWWLPTPSYLSGITQYPAIHTALETLSIVVAMLVFGITWNAYRQERADNLIFLGSAMLTVGLIDFAHMLSFQGMPDFVTPSGAEKAINFWLAGRFLKTLTLLGIATLPRFRLASKHPRSVLMSVALVTTLLVYWIGLFHQDVLPATFVPGQGLTRFKIVAEWGIAGLLLVPTALLNKSKNGQSSPFSGNA